MEAYKKAYLVLFDRRAEVYQKAVEEIRNRPEWEPLAPLRIDESAKDEEKKKISEENAKRKFNADALLAPLCARIGTDSDKTAVANGTGPGNASLTEMESDLAAVDGLRSSVLVKLQELSIGGETKAPVRRVRVADIFNRPIQNQKDLEAAIEQLRDSLQKFIDEGAAIILE